MAKSAIEDPGRDITDRGIGGWIKHSYDDALTGVAKKAGDNLWWAIGSGFGKGLLIAGAVAVAGIMGIYGLAGSAGVLPGQMIFDKSLEYGLSQGAGAAYQFITSVPGILTLGVGGAMGAVADVRKHQTELDAKLSQHNATARRKARSVQRNYSAVMRK